MKWAGEKKNRATTYSPLNDSGFGENRSRRDYAKLSLQDLVLTAASWEGGKPYVIRVSDFLSDTRELHWVDMNAPGCLTVGNYFTTLKARRPFLKGQTKHV